MKGKSCSFRDGIDYEKVAIAALEYIDSEGDNEIDRIEHIGNGKPGPELRIFYYEDTCKVTEEIEVKGSRLYTTERPWDKEERVRHQRIKLTQKDFDADRILIVLNFRPLLDALGVYEIPKEAIEWLRDMDKRYYRLNVFWVIKFANKIHEMSKEEFEECSESGLY